MIKKSRILIFCLVFAMMISILPSAVFAAGEGAGTATGIAVNQTKNLMVGDSKLLILTAEPAGAQVPEVNWKSSNESVATVDEKGIVTGVKAGLATITATSKTDADMTASVELVVRSTYNYNVDWSGSFTSADNNQTTTAALPVDAGRIEKVWSAPVGNSTIAIVDDYIYTYDGTSESESAVSGGTFYKISKETGEIVNSMECTPSCGYYYSYTIYGGGLIYVGCASAVMAFDPDSFTLLWTAECPVSFYPTLQFVNDCVVVNGTVLNSTTGEKIKTLSGTYDYSSGVEKDGVYYVASKEGKLYAFDTETWEEKDSVSFRSGTNGLQSGVACFGSRLYWGESNGGKAYSVQIDTDGTFKEKSLISTSCGISTACTPVAANGRVYLAGTLNSAGVVAVFRASDLELVYIAEGGNTKIQSTPILRIVDSDGPVIASLDQPAAVAETVDGNYVFVQDYGSPSKILLLEDADAATTSASLKELFAVAPADYAYEQIACGKDGALYCTNDSGYLVKYETASVSAPVFHTDLSAGEVRYDQGAAAAPLEVSASAADGGALSYQWQSRGEGGEWSDIAGAETAAYVPSTEAAGTVYYRCVVTNTLDGNTAAAVSKTVKIVVVEKNSGTILYGDASGDGTINNQDVTILKRYLAKWVGVTVNTAGADSNGDGKINNQDVTILKRYLAKWVGVTLGPS